MKAVSAFTIVTAAYRFELTIFRKAERKARFVGKFIGRAKHESEGRQVAAATPAGTLEGYYREKLIAQCRAAIDRIDGPILEMLPRKIRRRESTPG